MLSPVRWGHGRFRLANSALEAYDSALANVEGILDLPTQQQRTPFILRREEVEFEIALS